MKSARFVGLVVLAALIAATNPQAEKQDGTTQATAVQALDVVALEKADAVFDPTCVPYVGYGSVTVLNDGVVIVRLDGDPPPSDDAEWREPIEAYSLAINPNGLSLVNMGGAYYLDRDGAQLRQRGLAPTDISKVSLGVGLEQFTGSCGRYSVLDIRGELMFEWDSESGRGYLEVTAADGSGGFDFEFGGRTAGLPWHPWCCSIHCGLFAHCWRCCPPLYWAHCFCDTDGNAVCECLPRFDSGGFDLVGCESSEVQAASEQFGTLEETEWDTNPDDVPAH